MKPTMFSFISPKEKYVHDMQFKIKENLNKKKQEGDN